MITDTHCHLNYPEIYSNLDEVVARAEHSGVKRMITICTRSSDFDIITEIASRYPNIYCSYGIHPHEAKADFQSLETIVQATHKPKVVGIGETGLDYYYEHSPRDTQIVLFRNHVIAAQLTNLPLIIHTRDAEDDTIDILNEMMKDKPFLALIHCFTASAAFARKVLDLGLYISISGIVTFKKSTELQEIVKSIPLDRLLLETDAPYLAPVPMRGKSNEPAFTRYTGDFIANLRGLTTIAEIENFYQQIETNVEKIFFKIF